MNHRYYDAWTMDYSVLNVCFTPHVRNVRDYISFIVRQFRLDHVRKEKIVEKKRQSKVKTKGITRIYVFLFSYRTYEKKNI